MLSNSLFNESGNRDNTFRAKGNQTARNFRKPNKLALSEDFALPPSLTDSDTRQSHQTLILPRREETEFQLRTGISHSVLTLNTQKEKATTQYECESE